MSKDTVKNIFKAYDIRGKVGSELNGEAVESIGRAFADWLPKEGAVAVGRDMRPDSAQLASALIAGLTKQGRQVWDIGEVTSDMIYFATGHFALAGGAMVTASHNPGEYNGIKLCREEAKPIGEESGLFEIRDTVLSNQFKQTNSTGPVMTKYTTDEWIKHVLSFIDASLLKPLKVAVDAGNGMAGKIFPELEKHLPFSVEEMYFDLDGTFPNHIANPLEPKNLIDLQNRVLSTACDVGIAFDGDGDRAVLVDELGEPVSGTVMTCLLSQYFLKKYPGSTILHNAICGKAAVEAILKAGGNPVRTRVGHSFIKSDMRTYNAIFAGEHSGHYYFKDNFMADSGLIAAIIGLYILSESGKKLSELAEPFRKSYVQIPETNFEVEDKNAVMQKVARSFRDTEQDWLDGLTVNLKDGWFNVRPSNTEPLLRLNAEARNSGKLNELVGQVTKLISESE
jgi:phosphomannomutase